MPDTNVPPSSTNAESAPSKHVASVGDAELPPVPDGAARADTRGRWTGILKDILLPLAGFALAIVSYNASQEASRRQAAAEEATRKQKYLEYFLANFADSASTKQAAAFSLLAYTDTTVRNGLIYSLSSRIELSDAAWQAITRLNPRALDFGDLNNFRIEVYYALESKSAKALGDSIAAQLKSVGFRGPITVDGKVDQFWANYGRPKGNEIRYDPRSDERAFRYLYRFLNTRNPTARITPRPVSDDTRPMSLSVFLPNSAG